MNPQERQLEEARERLGGDACANCGHARRWHRGLKGVGVAAGWCTKLSLTIKPMGICDCLGFMEQGQYLLNKKT